ncbi:MAG TPA: hypothetical protein VGJ63_04920 [Micromonosporaceae bacterium]
MPRRVAIVVLGPVSWHPPGVDPAAWRHALAEDVVDLLATLQEIEPAIAVMAGDRGLAEAVAWPGMPVYEVPALHLRSVFRAAEADGYAEAVALAGDAPDLPGLLVGKLLRPLTTRTLSVATADRDGAGLLGVAARLPPPDWLPETDLDAGSLRELRAAAPRPGDVAAAPSWRRMRAPEDLAGLDPALEGWDATRALLSA